MYPVKLKLELKFEISVVFCSDRFGINIICFSLIVKKACSLFESLSSQPVLVSYGETWS